MYLMLGYYPTYDKALIVFVEKVVFEHLGSHDTVIGSLYFNGMFSTFDFYDESVLKGSHGMAGKWCIAFVRDDHGVNECVELYPISHEQVMYATLKNTLWNSAKEGKSVRIIA